MPMPTHATISRRRMLSLTGATSLGLAGAALIGCSSNRAAAPGSGAAVIATAASGTEKPRSGGIVKYPEQKNPDTLDPYRTGGGLIDAYTSLVYSRLFTFEPGNGEPAQGKLVGDLVKSYEQPDPLTLVLKLNTAAKFDQKAPLNGRQVNAKDVVESWKRYAKEDTYRTQLANSANPDAPIESMEVVDDSTVRVKYKFADATAINIMAGRIWIQPVEGMGGGIDLTKEPRGSGPFLFESYSNSVSLNYKRNPNWFGGEGQRPYLDGVTIPIIPEQAQAEAQFRAKNLHFSAVSRQNIPIFAKELKGTEVAVGGPAGRSPILVYSYLPGQPWHDVRVRRAVSMMVNRDVLTEVIQNPGPLTALGVKLTTRWNAPIAGGYGAYWLDPKSPKFGPAAEYLKLNVAEAKKMLTAAGFTTAKPLEFDNVYPGIQWGTDWPQRVETLQSMFKDAGVKMNGVSVDYVTEYTPKYMRAKAAFKGKTTEAAVHFMPGGSQVDPLPFYFQFLSAKGSSSMVGANFPELDAMMVKQRSVTNFDERVAGIHDMNRWVTDNMVVLPVGPDTEQVDLVWSNLRGPQQYRTWTDTGKVGTASNMNLFPLYWFKE